MQVELSTQDQAILERFVSSGRFSSMEEAVHECIQTIADDVVVDEEWREYANERIEAGLADLAAGRTIPAEQFLQELRTMRQKSA